LFLVLSLFVFGPDTTLAYPVRGQAEYIAQYLLFGVVALLLVIPAVLGHRDGGLWRRLLAHPSLAWLGLVSYGIFLWQFPVMIGLLDVGMTKSFVPFLAVAFAGTVACAALSYYLLERPLMRRGRREPEIRAEAAPAAG
jgi:peptidoglycan/LPS O-acetylase OafA/YrhL